ncbi:MAG TPA: PAS domain-containing protein [Gammaproteobacteria bacterium]|nr:PAS domain-containing protein [Gammaproteobacteria bacterium]
MTATDTGTWRALRLLGFYRIVLAVLLNLLYFSLRDSNPFNAQIPALFSATLLGYLAFSVAAAVATRLRWPPYRSQALLQILVDIGAITLLMHASGGAGSVLSVLLVIAVATGALLLPGRLAYLFAAVATLALLFETGLASLALERGGAIDLTRTGLLGMVLFATAALAHALALKSRESEALARRRGLDLANLEQLNQYIIRQLQSGIVVVDADHRIRLLNDTARTLLGIAEGKGEGAPLDTVAPELFEQLQRWRSGPRREAEATQAGASGNTFVARFGRLHTAAGEGALILLEDSALVAQQSQQLKLASLGRLTASIAHEIRNPLGAIGHAAQLLAESEHLDHSDKRLTEIIGNHTQRVNTVIENVLQLSRRAPGKPELLNLGAWLHDFRDEFAQTENIDPARLRVEDEAGETQVLFDPGQLHQVLGNLCRNALRHGGEEQPVTLRIGRSAPGTVHLDVIDRGPGIDAATAGQVFEPFYTTSTSGTGLGLYIARELCELNQARLGYRPAEGGGSCFRIQFTS